MKNDVFYLPDFFTQKEHPEVFIHFYNARQNSVKSKIVYRQHMIGFVVQGVKEVFTAHTHAVLDNTQILLLRSGSVLMSQSMEQEKDFESILLFFGDHFVSSFIKKYGIDLAKSQDVADSVLAIEKDDFLCNFERSLTFLNDSNSSALQEVKLIELLLYLLQRFPQEIIAFLQKAMQGIHNQEIRDVVQDNIEKHLTVDELAFLCHMSTSAFKRRFTEEFGTSPGKYFSSFKMSKAKYLLQMNKRVSDIYEELGYQNLSSFSNEFKKHFGISPKQFQTDSDPKEQISDLTA